MDGSNMACRHDRSHPVTTFPTSYHDELSLYRQLIIITNKNEHV